MGAIIHVCFVLCVVGVAVGGRIPDAEVGVAVGGRIPDVKGYYWRDYSGDIPVDALPGGQDAKRKPIYIGQVLYDTHLVPAKIYSSNDTAFFEFGGSELLTTHNIKILCTQHPEQFEWIATNNDDIKFLTDKHLVAGGYDWPTTTTFIGRLRSGGEVSVGKIIEDGEAKYAGLYLTLNGKTEKHTSFQVLAYNPNLPKIYR